MDAIAVRASTRSAAGLLHRVPENATQRYLYRAPLDGSADPDRVTPRSFAGSNSYAVSPDGRFAFHASPASTIRACASWSRCPITR
jgi:dipeptidyl-peptidase-4